MTQDPFNGINPITSLKQQQVAQATRTKQRSLSHLIADQKLAANDTESYATLQDYQNNVGPATPEIAEYYLRKTLRDSLARHDEAKVRAEKQEAEAYPALVASYGVGSNQLVEGVGTLYGLITGDMDNAVRQQGASGKEFWQQRKPLELQVKEKRRREAVDFAEGEFDKFTTAAGNTLRDPTLLANFVTEQVPSLVAGGAAGRAVGGASSAAGATAATASKVAGGTALGTASALQGADVASGVYEDLVDLPDKVWDKLAEYHEFRKELGDRGAKEQIALNRARIAGTVSGGVSLATQRLPFADATELLFTGIPKKVSGTILERTAKAGLGEGFQEVLEETGGQAIGNVAKATVDPSQTISEGLGESAGLALVGGGTLGGIAGAASPNPVKVKERADNQAKKLAFATAVRSGDIAALTDPKQPKTYSPGLAAHALSRRIKETNISEEEKAQSQQKLDALVVSLEQDITQRENDLSEFTEENIQRNLGKVREKLAQTIEEDTETRKELFEREQVLQSLLTDFKKDGDKQRKVEENELEVIKKQLTLAKQAQTTLIADTQVPQEDIHVLVEAATASEDSEARTTASNRIIRLMMENPESVSNSTVAKLASTENSGLTKTQRNFLRTFTQQQIEANALKDVELVSRDIYEGGAGFKGMPQYQNDIGHAIRQNNETKALQEIQAISKFLTSHETKRDALKRAKDLLNQQRSKGNTDKLYLVNDLQNPGRWVLKKIKPEKFKAETNGGRVLHGTETGLVHLNKLHAAVSQEVEAIKATFEHMNSSYALAFKVPESNNVEPVQDTAEQEGKPDTLDSELQAALREKFQEEDTNQTGIDNEKEHSESEDKQSVGKASSLSKEKHPLKGKLSQSEGKDDSKTQRPLVKSKNFFTAWLDEPTLVRDYVNGNASLDTPFSEKQSKLLTLFQKYTKQWLQVLPVTTNNPKAKGFEHRDYIQYFHGDENIENIHTAIAFAAFSWLAENGGNNGFNSDDDIRAMLLKDDDAHLTDSEKTAFRWVGPRENLVKLAMGKAAAQALGMRAADSASVSTQTQLEMSFGGHALALLFDSGLVVREESKHPSLKGKASTGDEIHYFIRPLRTNDKVQVPIDEVQEIVEANRDTNGILRKLFGSEEVLIAPALKPRKFTQENPKGTRQSIPALFKNVLNKVTKRGHLLRTDMLKVRSSFNEDVDAAVSGYEDLAGKSYTQKNLRNSVEAKNEGILRSLQRLKEFSTTVSKSESKMFYFLPFVQRHQRVGFAENVVNPQSDKIHRHNISMESWRTLVDPGQPHSENTVKFKLAVAQGMGIDVDKQLNAESLAQFDALMATDAVTKAVAALQEAQALPEEGKLSRQKQLVIAEVVKATKKQTHGLDAIVNWSNYETARSKGETFATDIMYEVDGVNNGPALAHILLGAAPTVSGLVALGERFGFYTPSSKVNGYTEWRQKPGNRDMYESLAFRVNGILQRVSANPNNEAKYKAIFHFMGDPGNTLAELVRTETKGPSTKVIFGSAVDGAINTMSDDFIKSLYQSIEDAANASNAEEFRAILRDWNILIGNPKLQVNERMNREQAMEFSFNSAQINAIKSTFSKFVGSALNKALNEEFEEFIKTRKSINKAANVMFQLYNAAYQYERQKLIKEKLEKGEILKRKNGKPFEDLTKEDEKTIRDKLKFMEPIVHTPASKLDNNIEAGILASSIEQRFAGKDEAPYEGQIAFGKQIKTNNTYEEGRKLIKTMRLRGMKTVEADPGVALVILLTHAMESAIAAHTYKDIDSLHIHDAQGFSIKDMERGAKLLNKTTYKLLAGYSMPLEILATYERTVKGFEGYLENADVGFMDSLHESLFKALNTKKTETFDIQEALNAITHTGDVLRTEAYQSELKKLTYLKEVSVVDQFALENGSYAVEDAVRTLVENKLKALQAKAARPESNRQPVKQPTQKESRVKATVQAEDSPWGRVGLSLVQSDPVLVDLLSTPKHISVKDIIGPLASRIRETVQNPRIQKFQLELLKQIRDTLDLNMPIRYIKPETPRAVEDSEDLDSANGWYVLGENSVNIKSPDFVNSGITTELLLHELTHAAIAQAIESSPNSVAVKGLDTLREAAEVFIKENNLNQYSKAVKDVHELIAWGMTNAGFQREVLNKLQIPELDVRKRRVTSGFRAFIKSLLNILFRGTTKPLDDVYQNGMAILIAHTGLLFEKTTHVTSKTETKILKQENADPTTFTTEEVYRALGTIGHSRVTDPIQDQHLRSLLNGVVNAAYGTFSGAKAPAERRAALTAEDTFLNALATEEMPFVSKAKGQLLLNDQEAFVLESVELAVKESLNSATLVRNELRKLFNQAKQNLAPKDFYVGNWDTANDQEREIAQSTYDFIFRLDSSSDTTSDFLSRFAAIGLVYKPLHDKLSRIQAGTTDIQSYRNLNLAQRLKLLVLRLLDAISKKWAKVSFAQPADTALLALSQRLAHLEGRRKGKLLRKLAHSDNVLERGIETLSNAGRNTLEHIAGSKVFTESKLGVVRATGSLARAVAGDRADLIVDGILKHRDTLFEGRQGAFAAILREGRKTKDHDLPFYALLREATKLEHTVRQAREDLPRMLKKAFGRDLAVEESRALTQVLLRADVVSLMDSYSLEEIQSLLASSDTLEKAIQTYEEKVTGSNSALYLGLAKDLAYALGAEKDVGEHILLNAHNIARLFGTGFEGTVTETEARRIETILDPLISLYALRYTPTNKKQLTAKVLKDELQRKDNDNGILFVLQMQRRMKKDALGTAFDGNPIHMMKGYTKDILNTSTDLQIVTEDEKITYERAGYAYHGMVQRDPADIEREPLHIFSMRDYGLPKYIAGIASLAGKRTRGSTVHSGFMSSEKDKTFFGNIKKTQEIANKKQAKIAQLAVNGRQYDPAKVNEKNNAIARLVPVLDLNGTVVTHRKRMTGHSKDIIFERDDRIEHVMGGMAANMLNKVQGETNNKTLIDALHEQYKAEYNERPTDYIEFSESSADADIRESYRLLPNATKEYIHKVWGRNGVFVRKDLLDMTFGYRQFSLVNLFDKDTAESGMIEQIATQLFIHFLEGIWGPKAKYKLRKSEDIWLEVVRAFKDNVVIKTLTTLINNHIANATELFWAGVPILDIVKGLVTGTIYTLQYQRDAKALRDIKHFLDSGYLIGKDEESLKQQVIELQDALKRNPVSKLMDAGLFQTVAEEIDVEEDPYSYKSRLVREVDSKTQWIPGGVKTAAKQVLLTHDTTPYRVLAQSTQISDFVSRYTLYEHVTTRRKDTLTHEEAIQFADEAFVNYNVPLQRKLQYLDAMGIVMFIRYYLRIQKVLFRLWKENPARGLALLAFNKLFAGANIMDSVFWEFLDSPLSAGAFEYPGSLDELITVKAVMSPLNQ
jgi:hypothetical protein